MWTWLACTAPTTPPGSTTAPGSEPTSPVEATGETGVPTVWSPPPPTGDTAAEPIVCDDHLACSAESVDGQGRCLETPLYDCGWPAAAPSGAIDLTEVDPGFSTNLSGIAWNPVARHLWLARNAGPSKVWRVVEDGAGGWVVDADAYGVPAEWSDLGDLESLAVADPVGAPYAVTVLDEGESSLVRYDLSGGGAVLLDTWDLSDWLPDDPPSGAEGLTFVPDQALADWGFVDEAGQPRQSALGMGSLAFVGHQNGGRIYVFDLGPDGAVDPVNAFDTARDETSGLEFDASTGRLYVWHGAGWNDLEVTRLSSSPGPRPKLDTEYVFDQPADGNLEGMALLGVEDCADGGRSLFLADDAGGERALLRYPDWPVGCP